MRATAFEFRHRVFLLAAIVAIGFWSPGFHGPTVWMLATGWLSHNHWLGIQAASLAVGEAAAVVAFMAAALRTWGAAYLGTGVVLSGNFHSQTVVAAGPFRYVRNPLYLGSGLHFLALAIFMPLAGAVFVLAAVALVFARIIGAEEALLANTAGYAEYRARVPRMWPSVRARVAASELRPRWAQALLGEIYCWGVAIGFSLLVWQFNATLLLQAVIVSFGVSLVVRGLWPARKTAAPVAA
jgi:protein-S-isoprenylcysteine O-methyltransferase Ste14